MTVRIERAYESPTRGDGFRVLVDRLWPRGMSKEKLHIDEWLKDVAPSDGLRRWFGHDPAKFDEFAKRYRAEIEGGEALARLRTIVREHPTVTLVYAAKDEEHNNAVVLADLLRHPSS